MHLLTLEESLQLDVSHANELYKKHLNPGLFRLYRMLGTSNLDIVSAEGMEILLSDGRRLLDFSSAMGVAALGHNHPRIIAAEKRCHDGKILDALKVGPVKLQSALAYNLCEFLPDSLSI